MKERQAGEKKRKAEWVEYLPIRRTKLRAYLMATGVLIGLFDANRIELLPVALGVIFIAVATWVHVWSKGHLDKNASLTRSGPYRWVRDPFHFANFFIDLGLCLIVNNWIFTIIAMIFWVIAYSHRLGEEDEMLLEIFGDDYREYRARIPRMIPYRKPMEKKYDKPFSVRHAPIYHGKVCTRMFRFAAYPYLLLLAALAGSAGFDVFPPAQHALFYWAGFGYLFFWVLGEAAGKLMTKRAPLVPRGWLKQPVPAIVAAIILSGLWVLENTGLTEPAWQVATADVFGLVLLATAVIVLGRRVWGSVRFRRLFEGAGLTLACLFAPLAWVAVVPACYFAVAFLYGDPHRQEANVDEVFPAAEHLWPMATWVGLSAVYAIIGGLIVLG